MSETTPTKPEWTEGPWHRDGRTVYALQQDVWYKGDPAGLVNRFSFNVQWGWPRAPDEELEAVATLAAASPALYAALEAMVEAYWRGFEDSSDAKAPPCVKLALTALNAANPARGK